MLVIWETKSNALAMGDRVSFGGLGDRVSVTMDLQKQTRTTDNAPDTIPERIAAKRLLSLADNVSRQIPSGNEPKVDFEKNFTKFSRAMGDFLGQRRSLLTGAEAAF